MYGIYLNSQTGGEAVLLEDGCWTAERNCFKREFGYVWHKPKLFHTRGGARNYTELNGLVGKCYCVRKYSGATEPWVRAATEPG